MKIIQAGFGAVVGSVAGFITMYGAGICGLVIGSIVVFVLKGTFIASDKFVELMPMVLRMGIAGAPCGAIAGILRFGEIS